MSFTAIFPSISLCFTLTLIWIIIVATSRLCFPNLRCFLPCSIDDHRRIYKRFERQIYCDVHTIWNSNNKCGKSTETRYEELTVTFESLFLRRIPAKRGPLNHFWWPALWITPSAWSTTWTANFLMIHFCAWNFFITTITTITTFSGL
jgi:hypothetical protein